MFCIFDARWKHLFPVGTVEFDAIVYLFPVGAVVFVYLCICVQLERCVEETEHLEEALRHLEYAHSQSKRPLQVLWMTMITTIMITTIMVWNGEMNSVVLFVPQSIEQTRKKDINDIWPLPSFICRWFFVGECWVYECPREQGGHWPGQSWPSSSVIFTTFLDSVKLSPHF